MADGDHLNEDVQLLMIRGKDDNLWSVPFECQEPNESLEECCIKTKPANG